MQEVGEEKRLKQPRDDDAVKQREVEEDGAAREWCFG